MLLLYLPRVSNAIAVPSKGTAVAFGIYSVLVAASYFFHLYYENTV